MKLNTDNIKYITIDYRLMVEDMNRIIEKDDDILDKFIASQSLIVLKTIIGHKEYLKDIEYMEVKK